MITSYFRPSTLEEAVALLSRPEIRPLGGGSRLNQPSSRQVAVVDLQDLGLDRVRSNEDRLELGATLTLQAMLESALVPVALGAALRLEAPLNVRNQGTLGGSVASADGRSGLLACLLALDAGLVLAGPALEKTSLGQFLPMRNAALAGKIITRIDLPLNAKLAFESVSRTPADRPIVCTALACWPSGRTRLVLGGWGALPLLALDGNEPGGVSAAARNTFSEAGDPWASAEYRAEIAGILAERCLESCRA